MHEKTSPGRILIVSDSLGTPIHARGIFNFTCSAVQILNKLGFETCLLVEPPDVGVIAQTRQATLTKEHSLGTTYAIVADILKHFTGDRFRFSWTYPDDALQRFSSENQDAANFRLALEDTLRLPLQIEVPFDPGFRTEYSFTQFTEHLKMFSSFLLVKGVYSESFRRAYLNLRPVTIDASSFDFVYIDTPHFVMAHGVERDKVFCVMHDFIPFFDTAMGFDWRQLFIRKMECSIRAASNLVFNSETTKKYFERIYGLNWRGRQIVLYPPNRTEVEETSANISRSNPSNYLDAIRSNKVQEQAAWASKITADAGDDRAKRKRLLERAVWLPDLPFFCSVLSDEPRKNIAAIVGASKAFVGRANFVVMGQINGNSYMGDRPEEFPNLHFTGYVSDAQKFDLLRSCAGFIFPSLMEGFGIPIVEASMFGAPVICADVEVFREITFGKARYFDPADDKSLTRQIDALLGDPGRTAMGQELKDQSKVLFSQKTMSERIGTLFGIEVQ